ncbi:hypothetical protein [Campylobacter sp. 19-13652]|uniref:hypothetical protein n=1 Tax=Campylobacter sp. 19-13652 TaxID=2840180 RepID=UPI001C74CD91|nr:hypothetical protein [Campylobacter sp. 19-13652]BCX79807.1 hypothetical protein LBC_12690 [Campylobacter sp. 19-13652]
MKLAFTIAIFSVSLIALEAQIEQEITQKRQIQKIDMHGGKSIKFKSFNPENLNQQKSINDIIKDK